MTLTKAVESATGADFGMVRDNDHQVIPIKSATLDTADKTKVKLLVHLPLTDGKAYTVTYTASDAAKTQSTYPVTVTDGTVTDVAITPLEIPVNQKTPIKYRTLDATGIIISEGYASKATGNVTVTWDTLLGTMDEDSSEYILYHEGDTATFTVTYTTGKYDENGAQVGTISKPFTVRAVKDASVATQYAYTVAAEKPYSWSKVAGKEKHVVAMGDTEYEAYFQLKDANGKDVTTTCGYTVESSDNSIVVADGTVGDCAILSPVKKGSAYLMIKNKDGQVVNSMPIEVGAERTISTFKLSTNTVNVVTGVSFTDSSNATPAACGFVDVTAKDQYGEDIKVSLDVKNTAHPSEATPQIDLSHKGYIVVDGQSTRSSNTYTITANDGKKSMPTTLRVNTVTPVANNGYTYSVVFVKGTGADAKVVSEIDTTIDESKNAALPTSQGVNAFIVRKQGNLVVDVLQTGSITGMTLTKNGGSVIARVASGDAAKATSATAIVSSPAVTSGSVLVVTNAASTFKTTGALTVSGTTVADSVVDKTVLEAGTYTLVFDLIDVPASGKAQKAHASFTVKDDQTPVTAKVKETNMGDLGGGDVKGFLTGSTSEAYIEYYFGDKKIAGVNVDVTDAKVTISNGAKNAFVSYVIAKVPVADNANGVKMKVKIPVNRTFITTGGVWTD